MELHNLTINFIQFSWHRIHLGVQNLLVTSDAAMDADALQALETAAADAGVGNLTVHAADRFEIDRVSG